MMWNVDRLHPSDRGHRFVARGFAELLWRAGWPLPALPGVEPSGGVEPTTWGHAWWLATRGTAWVAKRCTDPVPSLVAMAAPEAVSAMRARGAREPWSGIRAGGAGPTTLQVHDPT